jgi:hypothetical protein
VSACGRGRLASAIPIGELICTNCYFFLDTLFLGFYTFVNCKVSIAGSMSTRQRENRKNGNQESSSKEASEEGSQENSKEEVSRQRNKATQSGDAKSVPRCVSGQRSIASVHAASASIHNEIPRSGFCSCTGPGGVPRTGAVGDGELERTDFWSLAQPIPAGKKWSAADLEGAYAYQSGTGPCHLLRRRSRHDAKTVDRRRMGRGQRFPQG